LPGTNILAYYEHSQITSLKSFITLGLGVTRIGEVFTQLLTKKLQTKFIIC
jgi:hypothetical protein